MHGLKQILGDDHPGKEEVNTHRIVNVGTVDVPGDIEVLSKSSEHHDHGQLSAIEKKQPWDNDEVETFGKGTSCETADTSYILTNGFKPPRGENKTFVHHDDAAFFGKESPTTDDSMCQSILNVTTPPTDQSKLAKQNRHLKQLVKKLSKPAVSAKSKAQNRTKNKQQKASRKKHK